MSPVWEWHFDLAGTCFGIFWVSKAGVRVYLKLVIFQTYYQNISSQSISVLSLHRHFCFFGEIIFSKSSFYSFSLKGFHYQFLMWRICLWLWAPCWIDPLSLGCAESHGTDLFTLISQVEASLALPESDVLSITFQNWQLSQCRELNRSFLAAIKGSRTRDSAQKNHSCH